MKAKYEYTIYFTAVTLVDCRQNTNIQWTLQHLLTQAMYEFTTYYSSNTDDGVKIKYIKHSTVVTLVDCRKITNLRKTIY